MTSFMRTTRYSARRGPGRAGSTGHRTGPGAPAVLIALACLMTMLTAGAALAAASPCEIAFHQKTVSRAIELSPRDLRQSLSIHETPMLNRVAEIENDPALVNDYKTVYAGALAIAATGERRKYPEMARMMADLSLFVVNRFKPESLAACSVSEFSDSAAVLFDGLSQNLHYGSLNLSIHPGADRPGRNLNIYRAHHLAVNELLNLWASVWNDARRSLANPPDVYTLRPGKSPLELSAFLSIDEMQGMARIRSADGRHEEARQALLQAIAVKPDDRTLQFELAVEEYHTGQIEKSLNTFRSMKDQKDADYFTGLAARQLGESQKTDEDRVRLYSESLRNLAGHVRAGGSYKQEAYAALLDVSTRLTELYPRVFQNAFKESESQLELAAVSHSEAHMQEFRSSLEKTRKLADDFSSVRRTAAELGLPADAAKDPVQAVTELAARSDQLAAGIETAKQAAAKKEAAPPPEPPAPKKEEPKPQPIPPPAVEKKPAEKPQPVEAKKPKEDPRPAEVKKPKEEPKTVEVKKPREEPVKAAAPAPAPVPAPQEPRQTPYQRFMKYARANDMVPVVDAFKAGYNGESCDAVRGQFEAKFKAMASASDAGEWAEKQKAHCMAGKIAKERGTPYFSALSDFLEGFE